MGNVFNNNIPSMDVKTFMRKFEHNGQSWSDTDRRGSFDDGKYTSKFKKTPDSITDARKSKNLDSERFDRYRSARSSKGGWFDGYKSNLKKTNNGAFFDSYQRDDTPANNYTKDTDVFKLNDHRPNNIHYNVSRPISKNQISSDSSELVDDKLGRVVQNFDNEIDRTKPSDIYKKVDEAINIAEKLEASTAASADQIDNLEALISVFDLMDQLITQDIANFQSIRNADKGNRGQDTGKQTDIEKNASNNMMSRTTDKSELNSKRQELQTKLVMKRTFRR